LVQAVFERLRQMALLLEAEKRGKKEE